MVSLSTVTMNVVNPTILVVVPLGTSPWIFSWPLEVASPRGSRSNLEAVRDAEMVHETERIGASIRGDPHVAAIRYGIRGMCFVLRATGECIFHERRAYRAT